MEKERIVSFLLRISLAFAFLYAGISSILFPNDWIGFLPRWLKLVLSGQILLFGFSLWELALSFWLLSNKFPLYAALASIFTLFAIIIPNITLMNLIFRDISILLTSIALAVLNRPDKK